MASVSFGRLLIAGKEGAPEVEFPIDKKLVLIGRCVRSTSLQDIGIMHLLSSVVISLWKPRHCAGTSRATSGFETAPFRGGMPRSLSTTPERYAFGM